MRRSFAADTATTTITTSIGFSGTTTTSIIVTAPKPLEKPLTEHSTLRLW